MKPLLLAFFILAFISVAYADDEAPSTEPSPPPPPNHYVTDNAGILNPADVSSLNRELEQFERDSSNQVLVVIYPKLPPSADIFPYTKATFNAWGVGQKDRNNGVVLFVFVQDHKLYLNVGRGLEQALSDAACKTIINDKIVPFFKQDNYQAGIQAGVDAILADTKNAFKGDGKTAKEKK